MTGYLAQVAVEAGLAGAGTMPEQKAWGLAPSHAAMSRVSPDAVARLGKETVTMSTATAVSTTTQLQSRARRLRLQAASLHPLVAEAYRRRAAELDLRAWLEAVWSPPPLDLSAAFPTDETERTVARDGRLQVVAA